jgi:hypothetical protein
MRDNFTIGQEVERNGNQIVKTSKTHAERRQLEWMDGHHAPWITGVVIDVKVQCRRGALQRGENDSMSLPLSATRCRRPRIGSSGLVIRPSQRC